MELDERFDAAIKYFKGRGGVVFANQSVHFWEEHGFVQQSLARLLTDHEIPVVWIDAFGWRKYSPVLRWNSNFLKIMSVFRAPGDRVPFIRKINDSSVAACLEKLIGGESGPVFWIYASLSETIAARLPRVDVFSIFDDPYRHCVGEALMEKARLIICQNQFVFNYFSKTYADKLRVIFPPFDLSHLSSTDSHAKRLPDGFPSKVMGYFGTFFGGATDFELVEYLLRFAPDWGIVFAGRTDSLGYSYVEKLKKYRNFFHFPWAVPETLARLWEQVSVSILPYRHARVNDGAFPVKILESLAHGVPVVATKVPKTSSLAGYITRTNFPDEFLKAVEAEYKQKDKRLNQFFEYFSMQMNPKFHLVRVAESLRTQVRY